MIRSSPAKSCPNRRPFDHVHNVFGFVGVGTGPVTVYVGIDFTLKNGDTFVYIYGQGVVPPADILQPIIDECNDDGCFYNCKVRNQLVAKIGPT